MKKSFIIFILLFQSCGWILDNNTPEIENLIGDYKILIDLNQEELNKQLVIMDKREDSSFSWRPIIDNCTKIYLDSTNIYVESISFDGSNKYSSIFFDLNDKSLSPFEVKEISKLKFDNKIAKCEKCKFYNLKNEIVE